MRAFVPLACAVLIAGGIVLYGVRHSGRSEKTVRAVEVSRMPAVGEAERAGAPESPASGVGVAHATSGMVLPIEQLKPADVQDTFYQSRGGGERIHEATDILAPRGTPVHAMVDGVIQKLFLSKPGGNTVYEFDENGEYCYYYAHLDHYADGLREGQRVRAGDVIGYVGTTGNADLNTPHLHLAFLRLGPEKQWWKGTPENPYPVLMRLLGTR